MYNIFRVLLLIIMGFLHGYLIIRNNKRENSVSLYSSLIFSMLFYFEMIPLIVICRNDTSTYSNMMTYIYECDLWSFIFGELNILIFTFFFHFSYRPSYQKANRNKYLDESKLKLIIKRLAYLTFIVGLLSFTIYIVAWGSISRLLSYAEYLRSFSVHLSVSIPKFASIMIIPAKLITVTPILAFSMIKEDKHIRWIIIFIVSLIYSFLYLFVNSGKTNLILMVLCFAIPLLSKRVKHPWVVSIILGFISLPILGALDSLFSFFTTGVWNYTANDSISYIKMFAYPFSNIVNLTGIAPLDKLRWGIDFIIGPLSIIPGLDFSPSYETVSEFYYTSNWRNHAGVPDDLITFGYLQFSMLGVVLIAIITGIILGKIDNSLTKINKNTHIVLFTCLILCMFSFFVNADTTVLVKSQFQLTVCSICVLWALRRRYQE